MSDFLSSIISACFALASYVAIRWLQKHFSPSKRLPHPPGPKGHPIIGNLLQIPSSLLWEKAVEWEQEYGDMIYLESLGQRMLLVNSYECATELLVGRSAIYSSRPLLTMLNELEGWNWVTAFIPYNDSFRKHRSYQQCFIGSPETLNYLEVQLNETRAMLKAIMDDPEDYGSYMHSLPGAVIMMNVYGHQILKDDRFVKIGQLGVFYASNAEHYFILDVFPWLKHIPGWFPWAGFQQKAKEAKEISHATRSALRECMTSAFLSENFNIDDGTVADERNFTGAAATLYMGGVDTSATALMSFVMLMLKNPEVQRKAQLEIDSVIGTDRLPTFEDKEDLPYIGAICAEVLRCAVVATFIIGHSTTEDDVYKGYHIPAGTVVLANAWAISFNPKYYTDPFAFKPERWLPSADGKETPRPPYGVTFGFGRRACPGQVWAENLLFIAISSLLTTFNFEKAMDEDGNPIAPNDEYVPGFIRQLGPSKCKITPRSETVVSLVESHVYGK